MFNFFKSNYKSMSMKKAFEAIKEDSKIKIIDVRTKGEHDFGHIPNSINISLDNIENISKKIKDLDTPLFVYCQSGMRSRSACHILTKMGYTDVTNIGGVMAWPGKLATK